MYKNGKLTAAARAKLQNKLAKENNKSRKSASRASSKRSTKPSSAKSSVSTKSVSLVVGNAAAVPTTATKNNACALKPSNICNLDVDTLAKRMQNLTMEDIADTPPPQKLVNARKAAMSQNDGDVNWISLIGYNQREAENEEHLYSKLEQKSNHRFRHQLDEQIKIKQRQERNRKNVIEEYRSALNQEFVRFNTEDNAKKEAAHSKMNELKSIREAQVAQSNARRRYEELKLKKYELREVAKLKKALAKEKFDKDAKKVANMRKLQQMLVENEEQKQLKLAEQRQAEKEAIRLQEEYARMLEEQERRRTEHMAAINEKQQQKFQALMAATKDMRDKAEEDARRAEAEQRRRQKLEDERNTAKKERLRQDMDECKKVIAQQIREKEQRIRTEIEEDRAYGVHMKKLATEYEASNEKLLAARFAKQQEQAHYLERQISQNEQRKLEEKTEMNATEKLMNKQLLDKVRDTAGKPPQKDVVIDRRAPYAWRYSYRKAPF